MKNFKVIFVVHGNGTATQSGFEFDSEEGVPSRNRRKFRQISLCHLWGRLTKGKLKYAKVYSPGRSLRLPKQTINEFFLANDRLILPT